MPAPPWNAQTPTRSEPFMSPESRAGALSPHLGAGGNDAGSSTRPAHRADAESGCPCRWGDPRARPRSQSARGRRPLVAPCRTPANEGERRSQPSLTLASFPDGGHLLVRVRSGESKARCQAGDERQANAESPVATATTTIANAADSWPASSNAMQSTTTSVPTTVDTANLVRFAPTSNQAARTSAATPTRPPAVASSGYTRNAYATPASTFAAAIRRRSAPVAIQATAMTTEAMRSASRRSTYGLRPFS